METKPSPPPGPDPDPDDEDRYAGWMGCKICYIFLTDALYDKLFGKLLPPHSSLNLNDPEVAELIYQAYCSEECEVVGDVEFLEGYFKGQHGKKGKGGFHCPETWA